MTTNELFLMKRYFRQSNLALVVLDIVCSKIMFCHVSITVIYHKHGYCEIIGM